MPAAKMASAKGIKSIDTWYMSDRAAIPRCVISFRIGFKAARLSRFPWTGKSTASLRQYVFDVAKAGGEAVIEPTAR